MFWQEEREMRRPLLIILSLRYLTIPINVEDEDHDSQSVSLTSPDVSKEIDIVEVEQKNEHSVGNAVRI